MSEGKAPIRVSMIVWNHFRNDARVLKEAQTLAARGYSVTVHALHKPGETVTREILAGGIQVSRVARPSPRRKTATRPARAVAVGPPQPDPTARRRSARVGVKRWVSWSTARLALHTRLALDMLRARPHIVHAHDVNTLPTAWLTARLARAKLVYDAHEISTSREGYARFRRLVARVERFLLPRAEAAITTTDRRAAFFARAYRVPRPIVLQNRPRRCALVGKDRIREELGLESSRPIVLYQGGLQPGRGLESVVAAAARIPEADFVFIGGGRLAGPLQAQVADLGLGKRVHFIPTVELAALPAYTMSADIGVQPIENTCLNHVTTDSNKLFEYIAAGLPVVASNFPEIRRIVRGYDLGLLVAAGDTHALTAAIRELVTSSELRARHARNARRAAHALTWEAQEDMLVALYARLVTTRLQ